MRPWGLPTHAQALVAECHENLACGHTHLPYCRGFRHAEFWQKYSILDTGSVVFDGTAKEVLDNSELRAEYLAI